MQRLDMNYYNCSKKSKVLCEFRQEAGLEPIPADIGQVARRPFILAFTPTDNLESLVDLRVFGLWEEAGVPGGNPR